MNNLFLEQMDYIFFIYGLALVVLGGISFFLFNSQRNVVFWKWFALFGFLHGMRAWLDMLALFLEDTQVLAAIRAVLMILSFLCLAEVGRCECKKERFRSYGVVWYAFSCIFIAFAWFYTGVEGVTVMSRYLLGIVAAGWAAFTFFHYMKMSVPKERKWFMGLTGALVVYGLSQFVVSGGEIFSATILREGYFLDVVHFPIQLIRVVAIWGGTLCLWGYYGSLQPKEIFSFGRSSRDLGAWLAAGLILIVSFGWVLTERYGQHAFAQEKRELLDLAQATVAAMNVEEVFVLGGTPADEISPGYQALKNSFHKVGDVVGDIRYIYLMGRREGKVFFYLDTEPSCFWGRGFKPTARPGDMYADADEDLPRVFDSAKSVVIGPYSDKWGTFVSAYIPLFAKDGGVVKAVIGIDILVDDVFYRVKGFRFAAIMTLYLFVGFYTGSFFLYLRERRSRYNIHLNEKKFHGLFREMLNGFALHEIMLDEDGKAVDYRFLEVNSAFERLTGLKAAKIIGRTAREVLGKVEPEWLERYGKVALTGETDHFEEYSAPLGKYFEVRAFSVVKGQFAVTFEDVTKRKRAMEDLARMLIRIRHQQDAVALISRSQRTLGHQGSFERITAIAGDALDVSRVSIWLGTLAGGSFVCQDLFEREKNTHSSGMLFDVAQHPMYFKAVDSGHVIDAYDALRDLRTLELATGYLKPEGIASALHVAIKVNGELAGLVCVEHKGSIRRWHMDETRFLREIADQIEILLLGEDRHAVQRRMESGILFTNALMDIIPQAVFYKDGEGRYQGCNAAFEKLMGTSCAELVGKMSFEVFSSEHALICHVKDMGLIRRGGSQSYEELVHLSDGSDKNIIFDEVTYCGVDGISAGMIGVLTVRDI